MEQIQARRKDAIESEGRNWCTLTHNSKPARAQASQLEGTCAHCLFAGTRGAEGTKTMVLQLPNRVGHPVQTGRTGKLGRVGDMGAYRLPPSTGLPDCRRPSPLVLELDLSEGRPELAEELTALPDELFAAGTEFKVEAMD